MKIKQRFAQNFVLNMTHERHLVKNTHYFPYSESVYLKFYIQLSNFTVRSQNI